MNSSFRRGRLRRYRKNLCQVPSDGCIERAGGLFRGPLESEKRPCDGGKMHSLKGFPSRMGTARLLTGLSGRRWSSSFSGAVGYARRESLPQAGMGERFAIGGADALANRGHFVQRSRRVFTRESRVRMAASSSMQIESPAAFPDSRPILAAPRFRPNRTGSSQEFSVALPGNGKDAREAHRLP